MPIAKLNFSVPSKPSKTDEKSLQKIVDALEKAQKDVLDLITELLKKDPLAPETKKALDGQKKICDSSRAPELKDLAKSEKAGELYSNVSKLQRLITDLNSDIANINKIEGGYDDDLDEYFKEKLEEVAKEIGTALPKGVTTLEIGLKQLLETFKAKNSKEHWARYDINRGILMTECEKKGEEVAEEKTIQAFMSSKDFLPLKYARREKIIQTGIKEGKKPEDVRQFLVDALDEQDHPSKARWAAYLELGAGGNYRLTQSGSYQGSPIHLTMSKDSWTANADGKVSISANSVEQILEKLLKTAGWMQLHATLEVGDTAADYPHVYLFDGVLSTDTRWEAIRVKLGEKPKWVADGQKALQDQLDKVMMNLKKKVKEAKDASGANV
jgi:hypothetical protein